jgi:site-specific DNA-methyltransferase (cytosine-N4-specific)
MSLHYQDDHVTLYHGDSLEVARDLGLGSVDCIVTSPPYFGLRDYGQEGQYGLEESPAAYVETMRALFSELRRVLADDGTLWLNLGDSYGRGKQLLGMPWRAAIALQDDGWILRNDIIWSKPNSIPESVSDRFSKKHEHLFLFSKAQKYRFNLDSVRIAPADPRDMTRKFRGGVPPTNATEKVHTGRTRVHRNGKNPGDVWSINTQPFKGAHFAVMPPELARRAVIAGCKPGGTVLDPFSGSGTTGMVARDEGRRYVGIDISAEYLELSLSTRLASA